MQDGIERKRGLIQWLFNNLYNKGNWAEKFANYHEKSINFYFRHLELKDVWCTTKVIGCKRFGLQR